MKRKEADIRIEILFKRSDGSVSGKASDRELDDLARRYVLALVKQGFPGVQVGFSHPGKSFNGVK